MPRLFVAIELPDETRRALAELRGDTPGVRWVRRGKLHLTLRFIGAVDEATAARAVSALEQVCAAPFQLTLAGVGEFSGHILWAGVETNPALLELQGQVEAELQQIGLAADVRPYRPHVKLGHSRRRRSFRAFLDEHAGFRAPPFEVAAFDLVESHLSRTGAVYERRARFPLAVTPG